MPSTYEQVVRVDMPALYMLEVDPKSKKMKPNYMKNNQEKLLKERMPTLKYVEPPELE